MNFKIGYGDYTEESGYFGMAKVTMGGITYVLSDSSGHRVSLRVLTDVLCHSVKTQIAVANTANIIADETSSGMLGLGFPSL